MNAAVAGLVTAHLLRVVDLATEAGTGVDVDWHVRDAVAAQAARVAYIGVLQAAAAARNLRRD